MKSNKNQHNTITPDDPMLTAFALGELDASESKTIAAQVERSEELQAAVAEIRETAELLTAEFRAEPTQELSREARDAIRMGDDNSSSSLIRFRRIVPMAMAATLMVVATASFFTFRNSEDDRRGHFASQMRNIGVSAKMYAQFDSQPIVAPTPVGGAEITHSEPFQIAAQMRGRRSVDLNIYPDADHAVASVKWDSVADGMLAQAVDATSARRSAYNAFGLSRSPHAYYYQAADHYKPGEQSDLAGIRFSYDGAPSFDGNAGNTESYSTVTENPFRHATDHPLSTFSIDVDSASYANIRRYLNSNQLPPPGAVRIEEMINYFDYDYPQPDGEHPFSVNVEYAVCPWEPDHGLVMVGLQGYEVDDADRPPANLVFLIDVSGSMNSPNKIGLVQESLRMLVEELGRDDYISIVVYAGNSGLVLPSTSCSQSGVIVDAIDRLRAGGTTNGGEGIQLAYDVASEQFIEGGINRVILATDGDFNVGITNQGALVNLIEEQAESGVFLSVLGFGMGNYKDSTLEQLADRGNGNYAYIDDIAEAEKVLVKQMGGTLMTIAKDVKIQIEFNPSQVAAYRLIGYENRMLQARDFNDDKKDAGEIGAGHTVTALYEIVPAGTSVPQSDIDPLKYQQPSEVAALVESDELMTVKLRFKNPDEDVSQLIEVAVSTEMKDFADASDNFALASSVAAMGMMLRGSANCPQMSYPDALRMADSAVGNDVDGYREELCGLLEKVIRLSEQGGR